MKKILFILVLIFTLLISCEKEELRPDKLDGIYVSETFQLADLDSVIMNLKIEIDVIKEVFLSPIKFEDKHVFKIDSIFNNTIIYFSFEKEYNLKVPIYYGVLKINKSNSKLIGYLNINKPLTLSDRWEYILYFNRK